MPKLMAVLTGGRHLKFLWMCDESQYPAVLSIIHKFVKTVVNLLPYILERARHSDVYLYGGEQDEEHRRYRYIRSSCHETKVKWSPLLSENTRSNEHAADLIQILREVLGFEAPEGVKPVVERVCRQNAGEEEEPEGGEDEEEAGESENGEVKKKEYKYVKMAPPERPILSLVYSDVKLMTTLLKLLAINNYGELPEIVSNKTNKNEFYSDLVQHLFSQFIHYLDGYCKDHSCFFEPILQALHSTSSELRVSKAFMTMVGRLTSEFVSESNQEKLINFISEGGGRLILECLVSGCKQNSPSISQGIMTQSINKLGQKDTLKSSASGNQQINFFPHATVRLHPSRTSVKDLQSSSTTDTPTRTACFNHTYQNGEKWLDMQISLPYPILLHSVQFLQPMGMFQSGPSAVFIECGTQGALSPPTPVTSLLRTSGLPCIKIEFKRPPVASEVVIHFRVPLVSSSLALSHMQLLGTGFGTSTKSSSQSTTPIIVAEDNGSKPGSEGHSRWVVPWL